jgi:23S rRNA pseudouridine1911/1915/1917 synthase
LEKTSLIISGDIFHTGVGGSRDDESGDSATEFDVGPDTGPSTEMCSLVVAAQHHGMRLDQALVQLVPEFSRSYLQQLIELGAVRINGGVMSKASARVKLGDAGIIELRPTPQSQAFKPQAMALDVVYGDDHLLVINKPAGLVVHPAPGNWSGTLLNGLLALDPKAASLPRAGIVHRLDKDTSGLMVVARTRTVMDALVQRIAQRQVSRQYLAVSPKPWAGAASRVVDAPIGRDPRNRLRMAAVDLTRSPGKVAKTTVELMDTSALGSLVRCTLHTGRTHQIRVHMALLGYPLAADELYGGVCVAGLHRQALHAWRLAFSHPVTAHNMVFTCPLPDDMQSALSQLALSYNQARIDT